MTIAGRIRHLTRIGLSHMNEAILDVLFHSHGQPDGLTAAEIHERMGLGNDFGGSPTASSRACFAAWRVKAASHPLPPGARKANSPGDCRSWNTLSVATRGRVYTRLVEWEEAK